jgi:hypothetical protein
MTPQPAALQRNKMADQTAGAAGPTVAVGGMPQLVALITAHWGPLSNGGALAFRFCAARQPVRPISKPRIWQILCIPRIMVLRG